MCIRDRYLSAPNGDGTFFDFVSEDVLRVFGTKAYLNTESVKEMISELTEENRIDEEENENVLQAADSITEDWIGLDVYKRQQPHSLVKSTRFLVLRMPAE